MSSGKYVLSLEASMDEGLKYVVKKHLEAFPELPEDIEILRITGDEEVFTAILYSRSEDKFFVLTADSVEYHLFTAKLLE